MFNQSSIQRMAADEAKVSVQISRLRQQINMLETRYRNTARCLENDMDTEEFNASQVEQFIYDKKRLYAAHATIGDAAYRKEQREISKMEHAVFKREKGLVKSQEKVKGGHFKPIVISSNEYESSGGDDFSDWETLFNI